MREFHVMGVSEVETRDRENLSKRSQNGSGFGGPVGGPVGSPETMAV